MKIKAEDSGRLNSSKKTNGFFVFCREAMTNSEVSWLLERKLERKIRQSYIHFG